MSVRGFVEGGECIGLDICSCLLDNVHDVFQIRSVILYAVHVILELLPYWIHLIILPELRQGGIERCLLLLRECKQINILILPQLACELMQAFALVSSEHLV